MKRFLLATFLVGGLFILSNCSASEELVKSNTSTTVEPIDKQQFEPSWFGNNYVFFKEGLVQIKHYGNATATDSTLALDLAKKEAITKLQDIVGYAIERDREEKKLYINQKNKIIQLRKDVDSFVLESAKQINSEIKNVDGSTTTKYVAFVSYAVDRASLNRFLDANYSGIFIK